METEYERSPSTVLDELILSGTGGFTRAMLEADLYVRTHSDCVGASANADQSTVTILLTDGSVKTFGNGKLRVPRIGQDARAAYRRCAILRFLVESRKPQPLAVIAKYIDSPREPVRQLMTAHPWFDKIKSKGICRFFATKAGKVKFRQQNFKAVPA